MASDPTDLPEQEQRLGEVVFACLQAMERAQFIDRQELLTRHPEFAAELEEYLTEQDRVRRLAAPLRGIAQPAQAGETGVDRLTHDHPAGGEPLPPGTRVGHFGDYELLEVIGQGGNGVVYRALQISLSRVVALKMILAGRGASPADVQRFHNEAEATANLDHSQIVPIYEHGE